MKSRMLTVILAMAVIFALIVPASASAITDLDNPVYDVSDDDGIELYAANMPAYGDMASLPYDAKLTDLPATNGSYTKYCFMAPSGRMGFAGSFELSGTSTNHERKLSVSLYRYEPWTDDGGNIHATPRLVGTKTMNASDYSSECIFFENLSKNTQYFVLFRNVSSTSQSSNYSISGIIKIVS